MRWGGVASPLDRGRWGTWADIGEVVRWLQLNAPRGGPDEVSQLVARAAPALDASEIVIYLADYTQTLLVPLLGAGLDRDQLPDRDDARRPGLHRPRHPARARQPGPGVGAAAARL